MKTVTRRDLAEAVYLGAGGRLSQADAKGYVEDFLETIKQALVDGEAVKISNFGTFNPRRKHERKGRNPARPAEAHAIAPRTVVVFTPAHELRTVVDEGNRPRLAKRAKT